MAKTELSTFHTIGQLELDEVLATHQYLGVSLGCDFSGPAIDGHLKLSLLLRDLQIFVRLIL